MPNHLVPIVATVFVMLFLWLSAVPLLSWYEYSACHRELADRLFQWHHNGIRDYSFEFEVLDSGTPRAPGPIRIHVRDGKFVAAYAITSNEPVDDSELADVPQTMVSAFELVRTLLEEHPTKIDIEYDNVWHFPTAISVSYSDAMSDAAIYRIGAFAMPDNGRY